MFELADMVVFGCLTVGFMLGAVAVRRLAMPSVVELPRLRRKPERTLASAEGITAPLDQWLEVTTARSGIPMDALTVLLSSLALGILAGLGSGLFGLPMPFPLVCGCLATALCFGVVLGMAIRRGNQFRQFFPLAIDMIARSVMAGESFEQGIESAASAVNEPVASELRRVSQNLEFGFALPKAMQQFVDRNPYADVRIFAHSVALHREMGGKLGATLLRLARVIRQRADYVRKIQSATSMGRFASIGICLIGVFALVYLLIAHPDYIGKLWGSETGKQMVYYAVASEFIGIMWVGLTLKQEY